MIERRAHASRKRSGNSISSESTAHALDSAYQFTLWVCAVADAVAKRVANSRRNAFSYRSADLTRAFKRAVYFLLINDVQAELVFRAERDGRRIDPPDVSAPSGEILAAYVSSSPKDTYADSASGRQELARLARRLGNLLRAQAKGPVWAVTIQPKFVDHLLPILRRLDAPYRFITFDDPATDAYLGGLGESYANAGAGKQTEPRARLPNGIGLVRTYALAFDAVHALMRQARPRGIVLSEGNAPIYDVVNEAALQLGVPVVCIQQGWSPIVHTGFRDLRFTSMVVWGDWFAAALAPHNPLQRFVRLGHHLIQLRQPEVAAPRSIGFFLQRGSRLISDQMWQGMLDLVTFAATALPATEVFVRDHPNGPLTQDELARLLALPRVRHVPSTTFGLNEVLKKCDVIVSVFSTTILEGIGAGAVPLIVNVTSMPSYYPDIHAERAGIEVKTFKQAQDALSTLFSEGTARYAPRIEALQKRLFASGGGEALERIAAHLRSEFRLPSLQDRAQR